MNSEIINPLDFPGWDRLVFTNTNSTFFHSSLWARVLHQSYGYEPLYFTAFDQGQLAVLIPVMEVKSFFTGNRGVSLPFTDFCDPILPSEDIGMEVWETLLDHGRKANWKYLEIRGGKGFGNDPEPSSWYYEHILDLSGGAQQVQANFRSSHKRNIKNAQKAGVEVVISSTPEAMGEFYRLNCMTRKMHGLPPQPYLFFEQIYEYIIKKGGGLLVAARYEGTVIAASIYFHAGRKAIYKYGASDIAYQHLRPNNLVMWKAIEQYCHEGYASLSFGRTDPGHDGLRQFKTGWGAAERIINYYRYDFQEQKFICKPPGTEGWHNSLFRSTPIPLLKMIGSALYRHMG